MRYANGMSERVSRPSKSSQALDEILNSDSEIDKRIARRILESVGDKADGKRLHRTVLWRYRHGLGKPSVDLAAWFDEVTDGRVSAKGWRTLETEQEDSPDAA